MDQKEELSLYAKRALRERGVKLEGGQPRELLSVNSKTGVSVNFPVAFTCRPSKVCAQICYACRGNSRMNMDNAHLKALLNYQYFKRTPTEEVAERLLKEFRKHQRKTEGLTALRWNGVGDLFEESVAVINYMALNYDIVHYVFSRKPELLNQLAQNDRVVGLLSVDESCLDRVKELRRPATKIAYLRISPLVPEIKDRDMIIFRAHKQWNALPGDRRDCPCDAHAIDSSLACLACKRCYNLESQHAAHPTEAHRRKLAANADRAKPRAGHRQLPQSAA